MSVDVIYEINNIINHNKELISEIFAEYENLNHIQQDLNKNKNFLEISNLGLNQKKEDDSARLNIEDLYSSNTYIKKIDSKTVFSKYSDNEVNELKNEFFSFNKTLTSILKDFKKINIQLKDLYRSYLEAEYDYVKIAVEEIRQNKSILFMRLQDFSLQYLSSANDINLPIVKNQEYIERFKEETTLLIKEFDNKIRNLNEKFEHKIKNYELDLDKFSKSTELFSTTVDAGLKNLAELNERTQNIEIEFSKILGAETEKVKKDLNTSRISLKGVIDSITTEANTKLNEINTAHTDFINLVSNAGIYNLTENYDKKAKEEQKEYKTFRKYTAWSIIAAIGSTLLIFLIAFLEHYFSDNAEQTNYLLLASRLSISVMFFVLAFYLSKQAAKHYECYQENHRTFLQLAALEPFMANMTPEEKQEIRKGLIPSYFNQSADGKFAAKGDEVDIPTNIHAMVNRLIDVVAEKKEPKPAETPAAETKP